MFNGIAASPGILKGRVRIIEKKQIEVNKLKIEDIEGEINLLAATIETSKSQIEKLYENTLSSLGQEEAEVFMAHKMMLEDPELTGEIERIIREESVCLEYAVDETFKGFIQMFESMEDEYFRQRAADLEDIRERVLNNAMGIECTSFGCIAEPKIYAALDFSPSDLAQIDHKKVLGFITEKGGITSHFVIMANSLEIPAVISVADIMANIKDEDYIILDALEGKVFINPEEALIKEYDLKIKKYEEYKEMLSKYKGTKSITKDGFEIEIACNIGTPMDIDGVIKNDGEGIGLFRTEFLFFDRKDLPSEEVQFEAYKKVLEGMKGKRVIIRTLDAGGDKEISYLKLPKEENPFLGYRAMRICLNEISMFKTQLRAIMRASVYGKAAIMFPMISSLSELRKAKEILSEVKFELSNEGIPYDENIEVGIMIEIPAAAIMSDLFAKEVDFFSIGTNDLTQYTVAVDRGNEKISKLYTAFNPAVLRLIKMTVDNGHKNGVWVGICGESAGNPYLIPLFTGMGIDELSMSAVKVLKSRKLVQSINREDIDHIVDEVLNLDTSDKVKKYLMNIHDKLV